MDTADNRLNVELHARDDPARALQERHQDWLIGPERCRKGNPPTASGQIGVEQALYSFCSVARGRTLRDLEKQWSPATRVPTCGSASIGPFRLAGALNPVIFSYAGRKDFCASASVTSFRPRIQTSEQNCSVSHRLCGFSDTSSPSYLSLSSGLGITFHLCGRFTTPENLICPFWTFTFSVRRSLIINH